MLSDVSFRLKLLAGSVEDQPPQCIRAFGFRRSAKPFAALRYGPGGLSGCEASLNRIPLRRDTEAEAQAAAAAAEVERSERAAAQGLSVQLKAEADRRAKVFHNAVKAGVAKVQAELEAERDSLEARCVHLAPFVSYSSGLLLCRLSSLCAYPPDSTCKTYHHSVRGPCKAKTLRMCRIQELQQALAEAQQEAMQAQEGRQQALAEAAARLRDAEDAGSLAVSAQEAADAARARERAARQAASEADARIEAAQMCVHGLLQVTQQDPAFINRLMPETEALIR